MHTNPNWDGELPRKGWVGIVTRGALPLTALLFIAGLFVTYVQLSSSHEQLVERTALQHAAVYSHTLDRFRALYNSEVVDTARDAGLLITHDYLTEPNSLPLPITLTRELERDLAAPGTGTRTKMYSPLPFAWRAEEGGLKDQFARDAWESLNANPEKPFYRVEMFNGVPSMRYAIAETLKPECVSCHNEYAGSPKTDWKVGDVRGVLEVDYPLHNAETLSQRTIFETLATLAPLLLIALVLLAFSFQQHRRWAQSLQERLKAREAALRATAENKDLRTRVEDQMQELLKSREQLLTNEQRLVQIMEALPLGVMVLSPNGELQFANDHLERLFRDRIPVEVWCGKAPTEHVAYLTETDVTYDAEALPSVLALSGHSSTVMDIDWVIGQRRVPLLVSGAPIVDADGNVSLAVVTVQDVTVERRLEREMQQALRMQAVGRLAGGVAHDFNNLLTAIMSCATFAIRRLEPGDPAYRDLEQVLAAAQRGESLTQQLLTFSRHRGTTRSVVAPNGLISGFEQMLHRLLGERIQLELDLADELPNVRCDADRLDQVLVNLTLNARDAMPEGGELTITTREVIVDEQYRDTHDLELAPGSYVCVEVADTGVGMSESTRMRIFEPFFTTKGRNKGTGLGLATCWGFARRAGGDIRVESEPGAGTRMRLYLPGVLEEVTTSRTEPVSEATPVPRGERIVVAEDDANVRELLVRALASAGYRVLEASNGQEALELCEVSPPGTIDLLVTDVVMPGMNGPALAREALRLQPSMRVLYVTGYSDDEMFSHEAGDVPVLQKPFSPEVLLRRVGAMFVDAQRDSMGAP